MAMTNLTFLVIKTGDFPAGIDNSALGFCDGP